MRPPDSDSSLGSSDPVSYTCTCGSNSTSTSSSSSSSTPAASVLLFYRYWAAEPVLPSSFSDRTSDVEALAAWYTQQTTSLHLGGKIRIAREGFNVTVAGTGAEISAFISACVAHWSFAGLGLGDGTTDTEQELEARQRYFKPSPGCACVFSGKVSVRVVAEATPMGVEGYAPEDWSKVVALEPAAFHAKCHEERQSVLVDVRNHYESRIGYFVSPLTGEPALRPPIRRFSQWPQYVKGHLDELKGDMSGKQILTYCTGGIRCEKGVRWMQERLGEGETVFTLEGGIAAYLEWMNEEIREGRKTVEDSLFKGKNYVFDARGAVGLEGGEDPVSKCLVCDKPSSRLDKCRSDRCHLVVVVCEDCQTSSPRCCQDCRDMDASFSSTESDGKVIPRSMCACEKEREELLWAGDRIKEPKTQGWRKRRKEEEQAEEKIEKTPEERDASINLPNDNDVDGTAALAQLEIEQDERKADKVNVASEHAQLAIEKYVPRTDDWFDGDLVRQKIADLDNGIYRTQKLYDMLVSADVMLRQLRTTDPELARLVKLTFGGPAIFELKIERQKAKDKIEVLLQKLIENGDRLEDNTMPQQLALDFES